MAVKQITLEINEDHFSCIATVFLSLLLNEHSKLKQAPIPPYKHGFIKQSLGFCCTQIIDIPNMLIEKK